MKIPAVQQRGRNRFRTIRAFAVSLVVLFGIALSALATAQFHQDVGSGGGGTATSQNYAITDTLGQFCTGESASANYSERDGFWSVQNVSPLMQTEPILEFTNTAGQIAVVSLLDAILNPEGDTFEIELIDPTTQAGGSVQLQDGLLVYNPPATPCTNDSFGYTIRDTDGNRDRFYVNVIKINPAPGFNPVPDQIAYVLTTLVVTNQVNNSDSPVIYTLADGAPSGATINPDSGVFSWSPARNQARSTNEITIIASGSDSPSVRATNQFIVVVQDYVEVGLGRMSVQTGSSNFVSVQLDTSASLTHLQIDITTTDPRLAALGLAVQAASVATATLSTVGENKWRLDFTAAPGQTLPYATQLAHLWFKADSDQAELLPLRILGTTNTTAEGTVVAHTLTIDGAATILTAAPMLKALPMVENHPQLLMHGNPEESYEILYSPVLPATSWQSVWQGSMPADCVISITSLTNTGPSMFFRSRTTGTP